MILYFYSLSKTPQIIRDKINSHYILIFCYFGKNIQRHLLVETNGLKMLDLDILTSFSVS
jgi:hypothetical protein